MRPPCIYHDGYLPVYYEVSASVYMDKPTAGWKANAYVIFDYFGPTDFKFAGLDQSTNKIVMGRRTAAGWVVDVQGTVSGGVKFTTWYSMLVAVNGTTVTVLLNNKTAFTHTFAARVLDGVAVGLNKGFVGVGSDNARGRYDNVAVQVLPPTVSLDVTETFTSGDGVFDPATGTWSISGGSLHGTPSSVTTPALAWADLGGRLSANAYLEITARVAVDANGFAGVAFDGYDVDDYKVVALDVAGKRIVIGHVTPRSGFVVDAAVPWTTLAAGTFYTLVLTIKGASITVTLNGALVRSYAYNSALADGGLGLYARTAAVHADQIRIRTDGLAAPAQALTAASLPSEPVSADAGTTTVLVAATLARARALWVADGAPPDVLDGVTFAVADLPGAVLAEAWGSHVVVDVSAAGWGWSPSGMDLLSVLMHELGHVLGLGHDDHGVMSASLAPGERWALDQHSGLAESPGPAAATRAPEPTTGGAAAVVLEPAGRGDAGSPPAPAVGGSTVEPGLGSEPAPQGADRPTAAPVAALLDLAAGVSGLVSGGLGTADAPALAGAGAHSSAPSDVVLAAFVLALLVALAGGVVLGRDDARRRSVVVPDRHW